MNKVTSMIHTLQSQSLEVRRFVLMAFSFGVTILILFIWFVNFPASNVQYTASEKISQKPVESPFSIIKGSVVEMYGNAATGYDSATSTN